jgi:transposase
MKLAREFNTGRPTIRRWLKEGLKPRPDFSDKDRCGRPSSVTQPLKNSIRRHARQQKTTKQIKESIAQRPGFQPSASTIQRILKSGRSPMLWKPINRGEVLRPANIPKRLSFC